MLKAVFISFMPIISRYIYSYKLLMYDNGESNLRTTYFVGKYLRYLPTYNMNWGHHLQVLTYRHDL